MNKDYIFKACVLVTAAIAILAFGKEEYNRGLNKSPSENLLKRYHDLNVEYNKLEKYAIQLINERNILYVYKEAYDGE